MADIKYLTSTGDSVDFIAYKHYGSLDGKVMEQLLAANKGLADYGPTLPAGITIILPVITTTWAPDGVQLWS